MGFILKLKKLEVRLIKKTLMQKEHQKMAQAMLDQDNFLTMQSWNKLTQEQKDMETLLNTFTKNIESQQDRNFCQDDNAIPKKKREEKTIVTQKLKREIY